MLTKNIIRQPKAIVEVQITIPWTDLSSRWNEVSQRLTSEIELSGFRKGQAPPEMVEPKIASQVQQELLRVVMPQALIDALQGTDVVPIDYPRYQLVSFAKGQDLRFNAQVTERPQVKVGEFKSIRVTRPSAKPVTEEDINKLVSDLFTRWKTRQGTSLPSSVSPNSSQPSSGPSGSLSFNGLGNQVAQASANLQAPTPDQPDDTFAKAVGAENLSDLRTKIRTDLESEARYENELDYEEAILQEVEKMTTVDVPEVLVQDELNRMLVSLQRRVTDAGILFDDYLKGQNKTIDTLKQEWRPQAEKNVRMELGLSEIARLENVTITDTELQAEMDKITDSRIKQQFDAEEPRMHLRHALRQTKTLNLIKTLIH